MTRALLLDLDGTLVHSDPVHAAVFVDLLARHGKTIDAADYMAGIHGRLNVDIFADLLPDADPQAMSELKEAMFRERLSEVVPVPGLADAVDQARGQGWAIGLVTNAPRANADAVLAALGLADRFDTIVIGDECERGKPDPLPYATGLTRLNADAARSLAVEDSPSGIRSARGAGLFTFGMRSSLDAAALLAAGADATMTDFNDTAFRARLTHHEGAAA